MEAADVVLRFLESVGRRSEAEFYLSLFRREPKERFAVIVVDANVARHATEAVVLHLRFLAQLGLVPTVVLGTFEPTDAVEHARRIERRLVGSEVAATCLSSERADAADEITRLCRGGTIPIVTFEPPPLADGAPPPSTPQAAAAQARAAALVDERFARLGALVAALGTRKLLFLHRPGGLRVRGSLVPLVNLTTDYAQLVASKELSRKERAIVTQARNLVDALAPQKLLVSITSPLNLLRELFTVKGAGTMLRRGAPISVHAGLAELDRERIRALLSSAFGRPPADAFFERPVSRVYLVDGYRGAAILVESELGAYLSKFAVDREAQGEGLGRDLWDALAASHPIVFWRARPQNPICEWYQKLCDGLVRTPEWVVFWRGLEPSKIPAAIDYALTQPIDIPPVGPDGA
jgi:acetylglutamate kinase